MAKNKFQHSATTYAEIQHWLDDVSQMSYFQAPSVQAKLLIFYIVAFDAGSWWAQQVEFFKQSAQFNLTPKMQRRLERPKIKLTSKEWRKETAS